MHVYPGIFMFFGLARSTIVFYGKLTSWSQAIRDKEFLVEMRLRNHESAKTDVEVKVEVEGGQGRLENAVEAVEREE